MISMIKPGIFFVLLIVVFSRRVSAKNSCGQTFTSSSGTIRSPKNSGKYPNNINCTWTIKVATGYHVSLKIIAFDLEYTYKCRADALYIYDGENTQAKRFWGPFCGNEISLAFTSGSNSLLLVFLTDAGTAKSGFDIHYKAVPSCREVIRNESGIIKSPNYPDDYYPQANCSYLIITGKHKRIKLEFLDFEVEKNPAGIVICYDHVSVYDVLSTGLSHIKTMCGNKLPPVLWSSGNKLLVRFLSDHMGAGKGFRARFSSEESCGQFRCENGMCISSRLTCNKKDDCGDNSDEKGCKCNSGERMCDNKSCIAANLVCNGKNDCGDRSDERNCPQRNVTTSCKSSLPNCKMTCTHQGTLSSCHCSMGYEYDRVRGLCRDINECLVDNGGCKEKCINLPGTYECACLNNSFVIVNGSCVDRDECASHHDCHHICINTHGGYRCDCRHGFVPAWDKPKRCVDINECMEGSPGCFGRCVNTAGSFYCICDEGFRSIERRTKCEDIDECALGISGCSHHCTNVKGSYTCSCRTGFTKSRQNPHVCIDINECQQQASCDQLCTNTYGSFKCTCRAGYTSMGKTKCVDINECLHPTVYHCEGRCTNTPGGFNCTCPAGYLLQKGGKCIHEGSFEICGKATVAKIPKRWKDALAEAWGWQAYFTVTIGSFELLLDDCMGIIVDSDHILTASHCLWLREWQIRAENLTVYVRQTDTGQGSTSGVKVKEIHFHSPGPGQPSDITLLKLSRPLAFDRFVHAICLPTLWLGSQLQERAVATLLAWERSGSQAAMPRLQYRGVTIRRTSNCQWFLPQNVTPSDVVCAEYRGQDRKEEHCASASGAPLMVKSKVKYGEVVVDSWTLGGILVYGRAHPDRQGCRRRYQYTILHRIDRIMPWIRNIISGGLTR